MNRELFHKPRFILIASIFAACCFGWLFAEIAEEIWFDKEIFPFDHTTSEWMRQNQSALRQVFRALTMLGNNIMLSILSVGIAAFLFCKRRFLEGAVLSGGLVSTLLTVHTIKFLSARERPVSDIIETTMSFPSGHAALSLFTYGFLCYLISLQVKRKTQALWIMSAGLLLAGLIGFSRLYLNVHWLSDVLAGFTLSAAYLSLSIGILETHRRYTLTKGAK